MPLVEVKEPVTSSPVSVESWCQTISLTASETSDVFIVGSGRLVAICHNFGNCVACCTGRHCYMSGQCQTYVIFSSLSVDTEVMLSLEGRLAGI